MNTLDRIREANERCQDACHSADRQRDQVVSRERAALQSAVSHALLDYAEARTALLVDGDDQDDELDRDGDG